MKISLIQLIMITLVVSVSYAHSSYGQENLKERATISIKNGSLKSVLQAIEKQVDVTFSYQKEVLNTTDKINIELKNETVAEILKKVLTPRNISFQVLRNNQIVLTKNVGLGNVESLIKEPINDVKSELAIADITIKGTVTDENGEKLPGVSITVKGTTRGSTTNTNGEYSIAVSDAKAVLVFSFVGYMAQEVIVGNRTNINIALRVDNKALDEVVVVGYGTQRKSDITGSTSSISASEITQTPVMSLDQAMTGRMSGVQVIQSNNAPGGAVQVQIRGIGGLNGGSSSQPLYVIDGVPIFSNDGETTNAESWRGALTEANNPNASSPLSGINPNDIESIDVLKDASATAIYGSRASNGVVIVTTKSGKVGKTRINADFYTGIQNLRQKYQLLNATEAMVLANERQLNTRGSGATNSVNNFSFNPYTYSENNKSTDWQDVMFTTGRIMDANLGLSGGNKEAKFSINANYFQNKGVVVNSGVERVSLRLNLDGTPLKRLTYGVRSAYSTQWGNSVTDNDNNSSVVQRALSGRPWQLGVNPDGTYYGPPSTSGFFDVTNPYYEALETERKNDKKRFTGNIFLEYQIAKGLKFKTLVGTDYTYLFQHYATIPIARGEIATTTMQGNFNNVGRIIDNYAVANNIVADQTLNYNATFNKKHRLDALLGYSIQKNNNQITLLRGDGPLNTVLNQISNTSSIASYVGRVVNSGLTSEFARVNYAFDDKYLFTGTIRRDGSSRFGPGNRYGFFPSASVGWLLSKEKFLQNSKLISDLKLRASWGLTGNQNIGDFSFISRITSAPYAWGNGIADGQSPANLANPNLKWESNEQIDIGLEASFLNGRFNFNADVFQKRSTDLLYNSPIPFTSGFGTQLLNLGLIENKGVELGLSGVVVQKKVRWKMNYNMTFLQNKVVDLGKDLSGLPNVIIPGPVNLGNNTNSDDSPTIVQAGLPIGTFMGYKSNGVYQNSADIESSPKLSGVTSVPGDVKYVDTNGDGIINSNDRVVLGNPFPDFFGGWTNDISYKDFTLNIVSNFSVGNTVYNFAKQVFNSSTYGGFKTQTQRWTGEGTSNDFPRQSGQNVGPNRYISDRFMEDGSFFRIRTVTLSYLVPTATLNKLRMRTATVYISGSNLLLLSKYSGLDPEVSGNGGNAVRAGFDYGNYPAPRTFNVGLRLGI